MKYPYKKFKLHPAMVVREVEIVKKAFGLNDYFIQSNFQGVKGCDLFDSVEEALKEAKLRIASQKEELKKQRKAIKKREETIARQENQQ